MFERVLEDIDDEILLLEPREQFDCAIIGIVERFNSRFALYSRSKVLEILASDIEDEPDYPAELAAVEHYEFNIRGGWVGDGTPAFLLDEE